MYHAVHQTGIIHVHRYSAGHHRLWYTCLHIYLLRRDAGRLVVASVGVVAVAAIVPVVTAIVPVAAATVLTSVGKGGGRKR